MGCTAMTHGAARPLRKQPALPQRYQINELGWSHGPFRYPAWAHPSSSGDLNESPDIASKK